MWVANTVIHGASALAQVMKAGVGVYEAFDGYSKQQEIKLQNQARNDLELQITQDILSGKTRMTTDENGQLTYTGLTPEAEAIRKQYEQRIKDEMGGLKWGNAGRATETLNQMYSDLNVGAAKMSADKTYKDVLNELQTNVQTGMQEFIKNGDITLYEQTMNQAKDWMSEEVWNQYDTKNREEMRVGRTRNEAMAIAQSQGMDAARNFLEGQDLTEDQRTQIFSHAQQASSQAATAATAAAKDTYTQERNNGATIGDAYRAAIANAGDNPAVAEAVKEAAQRLQFDALANRFGQDIAGIERMTTAQIEELRRVYGDRRGDYQDQGMLYEQHLARLDREILQGRERSGGSSASVRQEAENVMANLFVQFNNNEISGPAAITGINQLRELSPEKAAQYEAKILGGGNNPAAEQTYLALNAIIQANKPETRASADEKIEYEKNAQDARQAIFQAYYNGVRGEELTSLVEGFRKEMASEVLQEAFRKGTIGSAGMFGTADKTATAFAYHSARDNLDLRYSDRTLDARRPDETSPLTVGGEKAEAVMQQAAELNKQWANKEMERKGIQLTSIDYEKDSKGDPDGRVSYRGSDGNKYRVNAESERGDRYLERMEGDRWVKVDLRSMPDAPRSTNRTEASREAGQLANMDHLPMPPGYTGRSDDVMMRQEFISSYGLNRYKQFLDEQGIDWR